MNTTITPIDPFSLTPVEVWPHLPTILSRLSDKKPIMVLMNIGQSICKSPLELKYPDPDLNIIFVRGDHIPIDLLVVLYLPGVIEIGLGSYSGEADIYIRSMDQLENFTPEEVASIWDTSYADLPWIELVKQFRSIASINRAFRKDNRIPYVIESFEINGSMT